MTDESLQVHIELIGDRARIVLVGEVDDANVGLLTAAFRQLADRAVDQVDADLAAVDYLGSAGVRALVEASDQAGRGGLRVVAASAIVRRVLELSGLTSRLLTPASATVGDDPSAPGRR